MLNCFNPISLAILLLIISLSTGIILSLTKSTWFIYFLCLVFLGGVIVVVMFIVSICSVNKFEYKKNFNKLVILFTLFLYLIERELEERSINMVILNSFYQNSSLYLYIILIRLLILCIVRVISICKVEKGPISKRL